MHIATPFYDQSSFHALLLSPIVTDMLYSYRGLWLADSWTFEDCFGVCLAAEFKKC